MTAAVIVRLDRVLADRKITLNELSEKVGIHAVNLSRLKTGNIRAIKIATLTAVCETLHCQPGDILECIFDDDDNGVASRGTSEASAEFIDRMNLVAKKAKRHIGKDGYYTIEVPLNGMTNYYIGHESTDDLYYCFAVRTEDARKSFVTMCFNEYRGLVESTSEDDIATA